ncbi:MAG: PhnD/SsuA/transferrin family substrate-binding protein, partial [Campylobacteraceae bacterium]|nr:PhnD/SsuA/transferrin family substrate-binding protein [Campylobacteraceae bacterium]
MKILKFICLFVFLVDLNAKDINYGLLPNFIFSTPKEARLSLEIWAAEMKKSANLDIKVKIYEEESELLSDYKKGKIQIATFPASVYFPNKKSILKDTRQLYTFALDNNNNKFIQYYLIKNKKSKMKLNDLKEKNIYFKTSERSAKLWLDYLMLKKYNKKYQSIFTNEFSLKRQSSIVYKVYFKKYNYAVVPKVIYDTIVEMNPQISRKVEIIATSEPIFISLLGVVNNNLPIEDYKKLISMILDKEYADLRKEAFEVS